MKILLAMLAAVCFMGCTVEPVETVYYPPGYYGGIYYVHGYYGRPVIVERGYYYHGGGGFRGPHGGGHHR